MTLDARASLAPTPDRVVLYAGSGFSLIDCVCRAPAAPVEVEEANATHSVAFVRRGLFRRAWRGEDVVADATRVLFFNAGEVYRYSHPVGGGDDCTVLAVDTALALEVVGRHAPLAAASPERPFRLGHAASSTRCVRLQYEVLGLVRRRVASLAVEDAIAELLHAAVGAAYGAEAAWSSGASASTRASRRRRELVEAARISLNERLETPPSLGELGRSLGSSPFHLSRLFHTETGLTLRAYLRQLRARRAADRLLDGASDLTELALDLGFADHSHFTNTFRREWGVPPSRFVRELGRRPART